MHSSEPRFSYSSEFFVMKKAAEKAASSLVRDFGELEKLQVSRKGVGNYVTSADLAAESRILGELRRFDPSFSIICEESGEHKAEGSEYCWVVDPIDGTNNFRRGIPYFCINIALLRNSDPVIALTLDPVRASLFRATKNSGALVDGYSRLRVSRHDQVSEAVVAHHRASQNILQDLRSQGALLRETGSVALDLAFVAAGKYDAVIANGISIWDFAPGLLLIREAGGFVKTTKLNGGKYNVIAASSRKLLEYIQ